MMFKVVDRSAPQVVTLGEQETRKEGKVGGSLKAISGIVRESLSYLSSPSASYQAAKNLRSRAVEYISQTWDRFLWGNPQERIEMPSLDELEGIEDESDTSSSSPHSNPEIPEDREVILASSSSEEVKALESPTTRIEEVRKKSCFRTRELKQRIQWKEDAALEEVREFVTLQEEPSSLDSSY